MAGGIVKKREKWLHLRLTEDEYKSLTEQFEKSTETKLSRYARKVFLAKPVNIIYRNGSQDDLVDVLIKVQNDLNGVANNYNQMVHKLHMADTSEELRVWVARYENEKSRLFAIIAEVKSIIAKGAETWLR